MNILKEGDTKKVICQSCSSARQATFKLRDVPFSDGHGLVKSVLVGVCDNCNSVAVIPHQSTPAIKRQLEKQREAVESRVPAHLIDILNLASDELGAGTEFSSSLLKYYLHGLSRNDISHSGLNKLLKSELAKGKSSKRLSLKGRGITTDISTLKQVTHIEATTDLLKSVVLKINDDILVNKRSKRIRELQGLIAITV